MIIPFAQGREDAYAFMEGVNPRYKSRFDLALLTMLDHLWKWLAENDLKHLGNRRKNHIRQFMHMAGHAFEERMTKDRRRNFVDSVVEAVGALPKDELASMAEALVNLTLFRLRVSMKIETVGGPIDVAVISKGDGFVWIKRKHYFRPELNLGFIENYLKTPAATATDGDGEST